MSTLGNKRGVTLIELMVAMAIVSMVMMAVVSAYQLQVRGKNTQERLTDMNQTARAALEIMANEIRTAGCNPDNPQGEDNPGIGILIAQPNELSFSMDIGDGASFTPDGDVDDPNERVRYAINADGHLGRDTGAGLMPLARNVDALNFVYLDANGNTGAAPADTRSIQVTIVARAGQVAGGFMHSFTDTRTYTNPQGDRLFGPANDNFRRLLLTTTIPTLNLAN